MYPNNQPQSPIPEADRRNLLTTMEESLRDQPDIDASERETILRHFEDALQSPSTPATQERDSTQMGPDRARWIETLDMLRDQQVLSASECDSLIQQFDDAMRGLQTEPVKLATEFTRRSEQDGEAKAQEWLKGKLRQAQTS